MTSLTQADDLFPRVFLRDLAPKYRPSAYHVPTSSQASTQNFLLELGDAALFPRSSFKTHAAQEQIMPARLSSDRETRLTSLHLSRELTQATRNLSDSLSYLRDAQMRGEIIDEVEPLQ